ncbi:hypothetical protein HAZT_HAZT008937 [Hyalella azteca]|uniref:Uncharacterized protein n=1 Tax=Hyalella azteca TaxID=294128 RepID=A0A6A0H6C0_HYAAZ|nr:hypothetical protein HAZT_HAZT008937 [Hyalella azteca]
MFQSLQQSHLPQDQNVIAATQQFLQQFAALQAKAAAAPDTSVHKKVSFNSPAPATQAPAFISGILPEEPINAAIRQLHQQLKPRSDSNVNLLQHNDPHRPAQQQQPQHFQQTQHHFQQPQHQQSQQQFNHPPEHQQNQPLNHFQMQLFHHPQQQPLQQQTNHQQQLFNPQNIAPVHNQFGHVINPNRFPGPLADDLPAAVGGPLQPVGPTAAVHQAQQQLAQAHMTILAHHATLPQTPPPEKKEKQ